MNNLPALKNGYLPRDQWARAKELIDSVVEEIDGGVEDIDIIKQFGLVDGEGDSIRFGGSGSLAFDFKDGRWVWYSHELGRGGSVRDLDDATIAELKTTVDGVGKASGSKPKWSVADFTDQVWDEGIPIGDSQHVASYGERRGFEFPAYSSDLVRVVECKSRPDSGYLATRLCWRRSNGSFQMRQLGGSYFQQNIGPGKAPIILPGMGSPIVCEGPEDGVLLNMETGRPVWVTCGDIWGADLPDTESITVVMDNDTRKDNPMTQDELVEKIDRLVEAMRDHGVIDIRIAMPEEYKDTNDLWVAAATGENVPSIGEMIDAAMHMGKPEASGAYTTTTFDALATAHIRPIDWLIDGFMKSGGACSMAGPSNSGKTNWTALFVACCVTGNLDLMGYEKADPFPVMWCSNEEPTDELLAKLQAVQILHGLKGGASVTVHGNDTEQMILISEKDREPVENKRLIAEVAPEMNAVGARLVIFDPFNTLQLGLDQNTAAMNSVNKVLGDIRRATGATTLHIHHTPKERGKDEDQAQGQNENAWMGATAIYSTLDLGIILTRWLPSKAQTGLRKAWKALPVAETRRWLFTSVGKSRGRAFGEQIYRIDSVTILNGQEHPALMPMLESDARAIIAQDDSLSSALIAGILDVIFGDETKMKASKVHAEMIKREHIGRWPKTTTAPKKREFKAMADILEGTAYTVNMPIGASSKKNYTTISRNGDIDND
jgi:hypothetical protein